jgi:hypothetical protein
MIYGRVANCANTPDADSFDGNVVHRSSAGSVVGGLRHSQGHYLRTEDALVLLPGMWWTGERCLPSGDEPAGWVCDTVEVHCPRDGPEADIARLVLHLGFGSYATCPAGAQRAVFQSCADAVCQSNA